MENRESSPGESRRLIRGWFAAAVAALVCASGAVVPCGAQEPEASGDALYRARLAAEEDRHEEAIRLYQQALEERPGEEAVVSRELAYQYTWTYQLTEAENWFLHSLELEPDQPSALLGLARIESWQGRYEKALQTYRLVLEQHGQGLSEEDRHEAMVGEANVLGNLDRLEESARLLRVVLYQDPDDLEAKLDLARITNWRGKHREAAALYEEILDTYPENETAVVGLALAQRWQGLDYRAKELLSPFAENAEAREVLNQIRAEQSPLLRQDYSGSSDSDDLDIDTWTTYLSGSPWSRGTLRGAYVNERMRQPIFPDVTVVGLEGGGKVWALPEVEVNAYFRWNRLTSEGDVPAVNELGDPLPDAGSPYDESFWTYDLWATYFATESARFDLAFGRDFVQTPTSAAWQAKVQTLTLGSDLEIRPDLVWVGSLGWKVYQDLQNDNNRGGFRTHLRWTRTIRQRHLSVSLQPQFSIWRFEKVLTPNRGYYNPLGYQSLGLAALGRWTWKEKLTVDLYGVIASEKEKGQTSFPAGGFSASLAWVIWRTLRLETAAGYSRSRLDADASSGAGYRRSWVTLQLGYRF